MVDCFLLVGLRESLFRILILCFPTSPPVCPRDVYQREGLEKHRAGLAGSVREYLVIMPRELDPSSSVRNGLSLSLLFKTGSRICLFSPNACI